MTDGQDDAVDGAHGPGGPSRAKSGQARFDTAGHDLTQSDDLEAKLGALLSGEIDKESPEGQELLDAVTSGESPYITAQELADLEGVADAFEFHGASMESSETSIDTAALLRQAIAEDDVSGAKATALRPIRSRSPIWYSLAAAAILGVAAIAWNATESDPGSQSPFDVDPGAELGTSSGTSSGYRLEIAIDDSGAERIQLFDLPAELKSRREELVLEVERRDPAGRWKRIYKGELGAEGHLLSADLLATGAVLHYRVTIQGEGGPPPLSSGWVSRP